MNRGGLALVVLGLALVLATRAEALPAYSRIYQGKYGYRPSCAACHTGGGGSSVTGYGRDFLRAGANADAYGKIESKDSDDDGATNLAEVGARANPGDARSFPDSPGDWLVDAAQVPVPTGELRKVFPTADGFSAVEGTLSAAQIASAEAHAAARLAPEDKLPTFYFAVVGGKKVGVAQYVAAQTSAGPVSLAVVMDTSARVTGVTVLKNPAEPALADAAFLAQFKGKTLADAPTLATSVTAAPGAPDSSRAVATAVAKAIAVISAVFGR